jgi:hypothetical protein
MILMSHGDGIRPTPGLKAALVETRAKLFGAEALIEHLQLVIAKMKRDMFGPRSERSQRLLDQLELQLEELAAAAGEDEARANAASVQVQGFTRRKATRRNFPEHLPRRLIPRTDLMPVRRRHEALQDRGGCDRDARCHSAAIVHHRAREVQLSFLRDNHPATPHLSTRLREAFPARACWR